MQIKVNLRHLEAHNVRLQGELPAKDLDIEPRDEVVQLGSPLAYDLEVQQLEDGLLAQGSLQVTLECQCVRCLKAFRKDLVLDHWALHLPLEGEEAVPIVDDHADLTPYVREDILLEFPQHPLCDPECRGLLKAVASKPGNANRASQAEIGSSAWSELNKLKL